jgi:acyl carrier protein
MDTTLSTLDEVKALVAETLGIQDRLGSMDASTRLLGELPELDSMAVVELLTAMENKFGFEIDDTEFIADAFETLGTLASFVDANRQ